ncbi:hypothetical protein [Kangiella sp. TOML190]|uniref:hypothetical protein n=1 Tax=Kangiella sp. TOML190 TaxID=2931351 RepID=UPI0020403182|nr:hypothetical protein [Kangiella sp. TOML190]
MKVKKWLLGFFVILLAVSLALQIDDKQSLESKKWNQEVAQWSQQPSQAFYLQLGLEAADDEDPIALGLERLKQVEIAYSGHLIHEDGSTVTFNDPLEGRRGSFELPNDFCEPYNSGCIDTIKNKTPYYAELLSKNHILLERYIKFLALNDYLITTSPNTTVIFGEYEPIIKANKLYQLQLLLNSNNLESDTLELIRLSRLKLAQSNTLMAKMVHLANIQLNLDFYNQLLNNNLIAGKTTIPGLTTEESSLDATVKFEHAFATAQTKLIAKLPEYSNFSFLKRFWHNMFFKQNMSINTDYQSKQDWLSYTKLSAKEQALPNALKITEPDISQKVRNYGGRTLMGYSLPAYKDYSLRLHNLQSKINLINWYQKHRDFELSDLKSTAAINNFATGEAYLEQEKSLLCLPTPKPGKKNHHCIAI